eukprot:3090098-Ditylum_brightwellii.AAC.2
MNGDEILYNIILVVEDITIASTMGIATLQWMRVESSSTSAKEAHAIKGRTDLIRVRRCISVVARPILVSPGPMETRTYI